MQHNTKDTIQDGSALALPTGEIWMSQVNTELGHASNRAIWLGDSDVRNLAGDTSGDIWMSSLRGKSNYHNLNLATWFGSIGFIHGQHGSISPSNNFSGVGAVDRIVTDDNDAVHANIFFVGWNSVGNITVKVKNRHGHIITEHPPQRGTGSIYYELTSNAGNAIRDCYKAGIPCPISITRR